MLPFRGDGGVVLCGAGILHRFVADLLAKIAELGVELQHARMAGPERRGQFGNLGAQLHLLRDEPLD